MGGFDARCGGVRRGGPVLAKRYLALDELTEDNNRRAVFDRNMDPTFYDVLSEHQEALEGAASSADRQARLEAALGEKAGLRGAAARREAAALLAGERVVEEGDHAVLEPEGSGGSQAYYVRKAGAWVAAPGLGEADFAGRSKVQCDLRPGCVALGDECLTEGAAGAAVVEKNWAEMEAEFDRAVDLNTEARRKTVVRAFERARGRAPLLRLLNLFRHLRVQRDRYALGREGGEEVIRRSPHAALRDLILGQADLAKRQSNIGKFVDRFTRPAREGGEEDRWWLYCADSGLKLLPSYLATLARGLLRRTQLPRDRP